MQVLKHRLDPGTRLGRYELIRRLAIGGMAELYLARATGIEGFEKLVALKRILPQYAESEEFVQMFLDEARLVATLQHANIAQVFDIGQSDEGLFFTMEFVHGQDMRGILQACQRTRTPLPPEHALSIICGAAAGLHAAHERTGLDGAPLDIVHRDVSPSNILVAYDGCVKVIDFGIAKAARRTTETRGGTLKGKIAYMSPEQCNGGAVDRRSDVFALGILLHELTTGVRLFRGENEFAIMKQIVTEEVPPPTVRFPDYPKPLEAILLKALSRDPAQRHATAQELQLALEAFARAQGLVLSPVQLGTFMRGLFAEQIAAWHKAGTGTPVRKAKKRAGSRRDGEAEGEAGDGADAAGDGDADIEISVELPPPAVKTSMFGIPLSGADGRRRLLRRVALVAGVVLIAAVVLTAVRMRSGGRGGAPAAAETAAPVGAAATGGIGAAVEATAKGAETEVPASKAQTEGAPVTTTAGAEAQTKAAPVAAEPSASAVPQAGAEAELGTGSGTAAGEGTTAAVRPGKKTGTPAGSTRRRGGKAATRRWDPDSPLPPPPRR